MTLGRLLRALLNRGLYAGIVLAFLLIVAAYQARPTYDIPIGTATDGPLLRNFYDVEHPPKGADTSYKSFRWSKGSESSITFQDVGRQDFDVVLTVNGTRPPGQPPPHLTVKTGGVTLLDAMPPPGITDYPFTVPRTRLGSGGFSIDLTTNSFVPPGDERELGIIVTHVRVSPSANPDRFIEPPIGPLVGITAAVALLGLLLALFGWGAGGVLLGCSMLALFAAGLLVFDRLWLTSRQWYWVWPQSLWMGGVLALLCWLVGGWFMRLGDVRWTAWQRRSLLTLVMLAFAVRLAGQLHPSIFVYDLGYHRNIFYRVDSGDWLFTTEPAEIGGFGHKTFYLPTPYIFMEPLYWLTHDVLLTIRIFTVSLGTLGALPIFYLATRATGNGRAGLLSSALYLTMPMSVIIFSWGVTPNIFGEFFALCSLAVLAGGYRSLRPNKVAFWVLVALLTVTILSHPGVLALSTVAFLTIPVLWLVGMRNAECGMRNDQRRRTKDEGTKDGGCIPHSALSTQHSALSTQHSVGALGAYATAALVAVAIYYQHFIPGMIDTFTQIGAERANGTGAGGIPIKVGGSVEDASLGLFRRPVYSFGEWLYWGLRGFWAEAQAYYRVWPIVGAVIGYKYVAGLGRQAGARLAGINKRLAWAALGWTISIVFFALVGWATNLYVRYVLFALPIITLGAGILLSGVWSRGRAGRWLALLVAVFFAVEALAFWHYRINFAFK